MLWQRALAYSGGAFTAFFLLVWYRSGFHSSGQVSVKGAGTNEANGLYVGYNQDQYRQPNPPYQLHKVPGTTESWRLIQKLQWSAYSIYYRNEVQAWSIGRASGGQSFYTAKDDASKGQNHLRPPLTGWEVAANGGGAEPLPTVQSVHALPAPESERWKKMNPQIKLACERPATTFLLIIIVYYAYHLWASRSNGDQVRVASSFTSVLYEREYWRTITASFAHLDLLHLAFNAMSLHALSGLEVRLGTEAFFVISMELVILTMLLNLLMYGLSAYIRQRPQMLAQRGVGYSCVLFAWMVAESVWSKKYCPIGGLPNLCFPTWNLPLPQPLNLPINIAPIFLLFVTSLIMPNASFVGHLSGVILGYLLVWNVLPVPNPVLTAFLATAVVYLNERLFPWQSPDIPASSSSSSSTGATFGSIRHQGPSAAGGGGNTTGGGGPQPIIPLWPRRYLTFVACAQIVIAFLSISSLSWAAVLSSLWTPALLICGLRRLPWTRPLFLALPLLIISTGVSLAACASAFARGGLYHQLGLSSSTIIFGQALFALRALLAIAALTLSLCVLAYQREGQASLKAIGIEMGEVGSGGIAAAAFSGAGRTLGGGGGGGGGGKQLGGGNGVGNGQPLGGVGGGRRLGGTPTKNLESGVDGEYTRIPTTDRGEKVALVL